MQTTVPADSKLSIKTLTYQFNTKNRDILHNIKQAEQTLSKYTDQDKLDVINMPEMPFTGYYFKDREDIRPYLEVCERGDTFTFCSTLAKRLNCYVICGYPELYIDPETRKEHFYNSAYVVDRDGTLLLNYRKHFLYQADYTWAERGPAFQTVQLKNLQGVEFKTAVAICMDIEYHETDDPALFELAAFCNKEGVDTLFLLCAWADRDLSNPDGEAVVKVQIKYWMDRLFHLIDGEDGKSKYHKKWAFYCANRVGVEDEITYIGASCVFKANPVEIVGYLDRKEEGCLITELSL